MQFSFSDVVPFLAVAFFLIVLSVKALFQYERVASSSSGHWPRFKGPRLVLFGPFIRELVRVELHIRVITRPKRDGSSRNNVSIKADAVLYFRAGDPEQAIVRVRPFLPPTNMLTGTTASPALRPRDLDEVLSRWRALGVGAGTALSGDVESREVDVSDMQIRTVELTEDEAQGAAEQTAAEQKQREKVDLCAI